MVPVGPTAAALLPLTSYPGCLGTIIFCPGKLGSMVSPGLAAAAFLPLTANFLSGGPWRHPWNTRLKVIDHPACQNVSKKHKISSGSIGSHIRIKTYRNVSKNLFDTS